MIASAAFLRSAMQRFLRTFLFVFFFATGVSALSVTILSDELADYYRNKLAAKRLEESIAKIENLIEDYDALSQQLKDDPNMLQRLAVPTFGEEPVDPQSFYPKITPQQLAAAKKAIAKNIKNDEAKQPALPAWLQRCTQPRNRLMLFLAGAGLVIVAFGFFGSPKTSKQKQPHQNKGGNAGL